MPTPQMPSIQDQEKKLLERQRELQESMLSAVEQGREATAEDTQDVADQAVSSYQKELLFSQSTSGHSQLQLVREALARIQDGSYGSCINCERQIGPKRIEAVPWTPYCIDCQEKAENGELEDLLRAS